MVFRAALFLLVIHFPTIPIRTAEAEVDEVRGRAEQSFDRLQSQQRSSDPSKSAVVPPRSAGERASYSPDQFLIGKGQGDMSKGTIVCQRVSELSARTDLAKQIRILVKEHMVDRVRERSGKDVDQDIEVTREEIVQEYLQGVKIVDRQIDESGKTCSATAVMPKTQARAGSTDGHEASAKP